MANFVNIDGVNIEDQLLATQDSAGLLSAEDKIKIDNISETGADWNQNDESAFDYIKNRPFYTEGLVTVVLEEQTFTLQNGVGMINSLYPLEEGKEYNITLDGTIYTYTCKMIDESGLPYLGNPSLPDIGNDTGELFFIAPTESETSLGIMVNSDILEHTISITSSVEEIHHIDPKYIKDMYCESIKQELIVDTEVNYDAYEEGFLVYYPTDGNKPNPIVGDIYTISINGDAPQTFTLDDDMMYVYTSSNGNIYNLDFSMGWTDIYIYESEGNTNPLTIELYRNETIVNQIDAKYIPDSIKVHDWNTLENRPFYEGEGYEICIPEQTINCTVDGNYAEASLSYDNYIQMDAICRVTFDGVVYDDIAAYESGGDMCVYVEFTTANGDEISICESSSIWMPASLAGNHTIKVESKGIVVKKTIDAKYLGFPVYGGDGSHSVCLNNEDNIASGKYSYSEGYYTKASGDYSHAEGEGTIAASKSQHVQGKYNIEDSSDTYAHIVGNGEYSTPSNAHTLDWDGNAWFAGDITVGVNRDTVLTGKYMTTEEIDTICEGTFYNEDEILF